MEGFNRRYGPDGLFFTSDTHFWHEGIIKFCDRPFAGVEEMNEVLIERWNAKVGKDDTVFHLGDFCIGNAGLWNGILDRLNGRIHLIVGNHDIRNLSGGVASRFESVSMGQHIIVDHRRIYLCHYPFLCYSGGYDGSWQLFGHVHSGGADRGIDIPRLVMLFPTQYDVGVDNNGYAPVSYRELKEIMAGATTSL